MLDDIDIWRAAKVLIDRYGDEAPAEAMKRADNMEAIGDEVGTAVWRRIRQYVCELQRTRPKGAVH